MAFVWVITIKGDHPSPRCGIYMRSAVDHKEVVSKYIFEEWAQGRILGLFQTPPCLNICSSNFGVNPQAQPAQQMAFHYGLVESSREEHE